MRGKRFDDLFKIIGYRITPADAGKTMTPAAHRSGSGDHPRGCGENRYVPDRRQRGIGSPPRMRGKQGWTSRDLSEYRITPADAGKTTDKLTIARIT